MKRFLLTFTAALMLAASATAQLMNAPLTPTPPAISLGAGVPLALSNSANASGGVTVLGGSATLGDCLVWGANGVQDMGSPCVAAPLGAARLSGTGAPNAASLADRATDFGVTFNLKTDFGAKCDGVTDDTVAIQAWLNKATAGVRLVVPAGTCNFSSPLLVGQVSKFTIEGAGSPTTTFNYTGPDTSYAGLTLGASFSAGASTVTLSAPAPQWLVNLVPYAPTLWDTATGKYVGGVASVSGSSINLVPMPTGSPFASSGSSDALQVTVDLLHLNYESSATASGVTLKGFRFTSANPLNGGFAVHAENQFQIVLDTVQVGLIDSGDPGNVCGGYWFDGVGGGYVKQPSVMSSRSECDAVLVNSHPQGASLDAAELILFQGSLGGDFSGGVKNAIHMAGGMGGVRCDGTNIEVPGAGLLVDNAVVNRGNREFTMGSTCAIDAPYSSDGVTLNDTSAPTGAGMLDLAGWTGGAVQGHGINVISWPSDRITIRGDSLNWNCGSGVYDQDATTLIFVTSSADIWNNGGTAQAGNPTQNALCQAWLANEQSAGRGKHGYGIEAKSSTNNIYALNWPIANVSGPFNANTGLVQFQFLPGFAGGNAIVAANPNGASTIGAQGATGNLYLNATVANNATAEYFANNGAIEWQLGSGGASNAFSLLDATHGYTAWLQVYPGGAATIGEAGATITTPGNATVQGNATVVGSLTLDGFLNIPAQPYANVSGACGAGNLGRALII
ncbi:MAG TPA: glycosyl hydrolase family 28-related protein [Roseiarcus sp.]|nr:glycosyl hydrolase family 28-related protein [Roseiarcus sp.]